MVSAIVLAAGESTRMGDINKLTLPFGQTTIFEQTLDNISESDFEEIVVVIGHEAEIIRKLVRKKGLTTVLNPDYQQGMTTSIKSGIKALTKNADGYMICLSDMPLLQPKDYNLLIQVFKGSNIPDPIVIPSYKGVKGNPRILSSNYHNEILESMYAHGCKKIVKKNKSSQVIVEMETDNILQDIDNPEDYNSINTGM